MRTRAATSSNLQIQSNAGQPIAIRAQPAQPPTIAVRCARRDKCNTAPDVAVEACTSLSFGSISLGDPPCDIIVEVQNSRSASALTAPLVVDRADIYVVNTEQLGAQVDGRTAGFSFYELDGTTPLAVPFEVPIPAGAPTGSRRFKVRFDGAGSGTWFGQTTEGRGLRLHHDDPRSPVAGVTVTAIGAAPAITILPSSIDFGPVAAGSTREATVVIGNSGSSPLTVRDIRFETRTTFTFFTDRGLPPFSIPANTISGATVTITYTPQGASQDIDRLLIGSNDGLTPVGVVSLRGA